MEGRGKAKNALEMLARPPGLKRRGSDACRTIRSAYVARCGRRHVHACGVFSAVALIDVVKEAADYDVCVSCTMVQRMTARLSLQAPTRVSTYSFDFPKPRMGFDELVETTVDGVHGGHQVGRLERGAHLSKPDEVSVLRKENARPLCRFSRHCFAFPLHPPR